MFEAFFLKKQKDLVRKLELEMTLKKGLESCGNLHKVLEFDFCFEQRQESCQ